MDRASSFVEAIGTACDELRVEHLTPASLNRIAARLDQLGRRLHGLGWDREHEIGAFLTVAVRELGAARDQVEIEAAESVRQALVQLDSALTSLCGDPATPPDAAIADPPAEEVARNRP